MMLPLPTKDHAILLNDLLDTFIQNANKAESEKELSHWGHNAREWAVELQSEVSKFV